MIVDLPFSLLAWKKVKIYIFLYRFSKVFSQNIQISTHTSPLTLVNENSILSKSTNQDTKIPSISTQMKKYLIKSINTPM